MNKVENKNAQEKKDAAVTEKKAMKIRLKSGVVGGAFVAIHL